MTTRNVITMVSGELVSSNYDFVYQIMSIYIGHYCGQELANMILHSQNGCNRHDPAVSTRK